ncbi:MAG: transglutaminase, partial [Labilithrix sp.]|nr:transglutaminase [Labilithrix sp.]
MSTAKARTYVVLHETSYAYDQPVGISRQIVHLTPRALAWQVCRSHHLGIEPEPEILSVASDGFGNPMTSFCIQDDHASLVVRAESCVEVTERIYPDDGATPAWDAVRDRLSYRAGRAPHPADLEATRFLFESSRVRNKRELAAWTLACFPAGAPLLVG